MQHVDRRQLTLRAVVAVSGLSFWFLVGFPFANHNESFAWVRTITDVGGMAAVTPSVPLARTYRPLGQMVAVGTYAISGNVYLTQIFNFVVAAAAFALVTAAPGATIYTPLISAIVGGAFFAGFIYLFHLHGVFYSPALLAMVVFARVFERPPLRARTDAVAWTAALVGALFHPYVLVLFLAAYAGYLLRELKDGDRHTPGLIAVGAAITAVTLLLLVGTRPPGYAVSAATSAAGLVASLASTEVHWVLSGLAAALAVFTSQQISRSSPQRWLMAIGAAAFSAALWLNGLPVLIAWAATCIGKALHSRRYMLAGLVTGAFILPAISPTGSPTYAVFLLLACLLATATNPGAAKNDGPIRLQPVFVAASWLLMVASVVLLRNGTDIPVLSRFAQPLLAEREKTFQLERVIQWWANSSYKDLPLTLHEESQDPVASAAGLNARRTRPPTYQEHLDIYTGWRSTPHGDRPKLTVTFGDQTLAPLTPAYAEAGRFAGAVRAYVVPSTPTR